jgi:hypothetical protein
MGTVRVRNSNNYEHEIDERIYQNFPDDYTLVDSTPPAAPAPAAPVDDDDDLPTRTRF